jgi:hypothetical protein
VTPQIVAIEARMPFVITHEPGHMFVTDLQHDDLQAGGVEFFEERLRARVIEPVGEDGA